jgi:hypothetical protein
MVANAAAGLAEGGAGGLNVLSDPFGNLVGKPLVAIGAAAHDALAPVFGYHKFSPEERAALFDDEPQVGDQVAGAVQRAVGAPELSTVQPGSTGQSLVRSGVSGAVQMLGAGVGAGAGAGQLAVGTAAGGVGGVTGDAAQMVAPDEYKPVAGLVGNVLGGGVVAGGAGLARGAANSLVDAAAPALGRRNALMDSAGAPITTADGTAITATPRQVQTAGNELLQVTQDPVAVQNVLASPAPAAVQGIQPTTAQLTRDPGLAMQEYRVSRSGTPLEQAAFRGRQDANNDARVAALDQVVQGDPSAVPTEIQQQATAAEQARAAELARTQAEAQTQVEQTRQAGEQQVGGLQAQAGQALGAVGGDLPAGSDATIGQMLRQPIQESLAQTRQRESGLWNAIDPEGTLAVDMTPVRDKANEIAQSVGPNAAPPAGEEANILNTARALPDVQSFSDLTDLRSRLTSQIRDARIGGRDQEVRRLSQLLDGVHDTMEGSVAGKSASDNAAVQAGQMAPENAMSAKLQAEVDAYQQARRAQAGGDSGTNYSANIRGGSSGFSGADRTEISTGGSNGPSQGSASLQSQPLTPNFDEAAQQRYADARQATADRVATYKNAPGVGQALASGPTSGSFRTPDSAVPSVIVKPGPQGADTARAYLAAGGSPAALHQAAAYSLRQSAMRPDGTLDPAKYQAWAKSRASFLSQIPDAANRFGAAASAQGAVETATSAHSLALKQATVQAQRTVDEATASQAAAARAMQTSVLGKFLGAADPVPVVGQILRNKAMGAAHMEQLAKAVANNPEAKAGLQRAVAEYVQRDLIGNSKGATSDSGYIKNDRFQTFLRDSGPALAKVMTPEQLAGFRAVADSLDQANFSAQVGVGSPTAQLMAGRGETLLQKVGRELVGATAGSATGGSIGYVLGGPMGGSIGGTLGGLFGKALQAAREAGVQNIEHLKTEALLNPELFKLLTTKVTRENEPRVLNNFADQMRRISLVGTVQATNPHH